MVDQKSKGLGAIWRILVFLNTLTTLQTARNPDSPLKLGILRRQLVI